MSKSFLRALGLVAVLFLQSLCLADLQVQTYQPNRQDRFYVGADKAFLGAAFDWSGVGQVGGGTWATMVSPTYFVSAAHSPPGGGNTLTFYEGNDTSKWHTYTVASWSFQTSYAGLPSDLWLGRLTTPIPTADHITYYPVPDLPSFGDYLGLMIYVNGKPTRVGRNLIDRIRVANEPDPPGTPTKSTMSMEFDYSAIGGLGADECYLIGGDSGGASFVDVGGRLALVGTHYYNGGTPGAGYFGDISGDSFVPYYIGQLNANMVGESITVIVPEPASLALVLLGGLALLRRRK